MTLTPDQLRSFEELGLVKIDQAIPPNLLVPAQKLVEEWTKENFDPAQIEDYTNRTFAPELGSDARLLALFNDSRLKSDCESLTAPDGLEPVRTVQIALRVPSNLLDGKEQPVKQMHVDGVNCPFLPPGDLRTFTVNVGILLDDVHEPRGGALHYVPAGHKRMAQWLRDGGTAEPGKETPDDIASLPGRPYCGTAGDAVILHHLLPHRVSTNHSPHMRNMIYFRVKHVDHEHLKVAALKDPLLEFPGVRSAVR